MTPIRIATRSSPLAMWQARWVAERLARAGMPSRLVTFETTGDRRLEVSLAKVGTKGLFTAELEQALLAGEVDVAVHSAKDMPSGQPEGLGLLAFTAREQAHDVLVAHRPLPPLDAPEAAGLVIGTSSTRRMAQLARFAPGVTTRSVRGNLQTRLARLAEGACDALALAYAGVERIGAAHLIVAHLPIDIYTPAVGQGALALQTSLRLDAALAGRLRAALNDAPTERALMLERAYLARLEGGCSIPSFGHARPIEGDSGPALEFLFGLIAPDGQVLIDGRRVISLTDGDTAHDTTRATQEALVEAGYEAADEILARGGRDILMALRA